MESLRGVRSLFLVIFYFIAAFFAILFIPRFDMLLNPNASGPSYISTYGVTFVMLILMWLVLRFGMKSGTDLNKQLVLYTFLFNALIIIVKFTYSPISLYFVNKTQEFDPSFKNTYLFSMFFSALGIAILYMIFFFAIYGSARAKYNKDTLKAKAPKLKFGQVAVRLVIFLLLILVLYRFPVWIFPTILSYTYMSYVFGSVMSIFIALSLVGAIYFARMSFLTVEEQAVKARDATLLSAFFGFGTLFILTFHALWVVFMLVLGNIWPFKTYTSK